MTLKVPLFKSSNLSDFSDFKIWESGIKRHQRISHPSGDERTYLRALHQTSSLDHLVTFLKYKISQIIISLG